MYRTREEQLKALNEIYEKKRNSITVLYGRDGIGKTELVRTFTKNKRYFYFNCPSLSLKELFICLKSQINILNKDNPLTDETSNNLISVLEYIYTNTDGEGKLNIIIDEFQLFVKVYEKLINDLIIFSKNKDYENKLNFILISSDVKWVETQMAQDIGPAVLAFSRIIKLKEFDIVDLIGAKPQLDIDDTIRMYSVFGGVASYINLYNENKSFKDNIIKLALNKDGVLFHEASRLLKNDLRELSQYNAILCAMAAGNTKLNDLYERTGFSRAKISVYLKNLIDIDIVEKYFSLDIGSYANTKKGLYRIKDNFINFWYRCVYPYISFLEFSDPSNFYDSHIKDQLEELFKINYVNFCREYLILLIKYKKIDFEYVKSGGWYGKSGNIDICIKGNEGEVLIGSCKWEGMYGEKDLNMLLDELKEAKIKATKIILFSSEGFTRDIITVAEKNSSVTLIENSDF